MSGTSELARVVNSIWYPLWTFGVSATSELARVVSSTWYPLWTFGKNAYVTCDLNVGARSCQALRIHALPVHVKIGSGKMAVSLGTSSKNRLRRGLRTSIILESLPEGFKTAQESPRRPPRGAPKRPKRPPRGPQEAPGGPQERPNWPLRNGGAINGGAARVAGKGP